MCSYQQSCSVFGMLFQALLELLDQVEDVISVEDPIPSDSKAYSLEFQAKVNDKLVVKAEPASKRVVTDPPLEVNGTAVDGRFLVLEVSFSLNCPLFPSRI